MIIDELREIEQEIDQLKSRVAKLIRAVEKRRLRLANLKNEEAIGEVVERTVRMKTVRSGEADPDTTKRFKPEGNLPVEDIVADLLKKNRSDRDSK
ncbi:MAG: hypothetical protein L0191_18010 [Acidobacteria bacterium]|nr:hypothetical protein [Acidobacteriota bacterium]